MLEPGNKNTWATPEWLLDCVRNVGPLVLDPCTTQENPTGAKYIRTEQCAPDGLETEWADFKGLVYVNPPYGRGHMRPWTHKILIEAHNGVEIIALTRGDTSTGWASFLLTEADLVCFPPRIKFKGATGSPPFANLIFYFGRNRDLFYDAFIRVGPIR